MSLRPHPVVRLLPSAVLLLMVSGCTVGPDYVAPEPEMPARFSTELVEPETAQQPRAVGPDTSWWHALGDPLLPALVERALSNNNDLAMAEAEIRRATAARRAAAGRDRPLLGAQADAQTFEGSTNTTGAEAALADAGLAELEGERYFTGLSASWELDLFGGARREREAAGALLEATTERRHGVALALVAEVARTYTMLRGSQRRRQLAEKNVELVRATLERIEIRHQAGLASGLDLARARAQLEATRSRLPPLRSAERAAIHRLGVLVGEEPTALLAELSLERSLPAVPNMVHTGLPAELLRRRPDVRAAERRLAAANATIGARIADRWPRLQLLGGLGVESGRFADLFESASRTWSLGPSLLAPLFQGGRLRAAVDAAEAEHDVALARWEQSVLRALEDVENALVAYAEEELRRRDLAASAEESARAATLARALYEKGLADYLPVLDAERTLTEAEDRLAASETARVLHLVGLYTALGGGWSAQSDSVRPAASASVERNDRISP